jgi:hypothetical protein
LEDLVYIDPEAAKSQARDATEAEILSRPKLTFTEKVAELSKYYEIDNNTDITGDQILTGVAVPTDSQITIDEFLYISRECLKELSDTREPSNIQNSLWNSRIDNYFKWLLVLPVEWAILGGKGALSIYRLPVRPENVPSFAEFSHIFKQYVVPEIRDSLSTISDIIGESTESEKVQS